MAGGWEFDVRLSAAVELARSFVAVSGKRLNFDGFRIRKLIKRASARLKVVRPPTLPPLFLPV